MRALKALGIDAGGLAPERRPRRVRRAAAHPRSDRAGRDVRRRRSTKCAARTVFTTHTPVPAGHDAFPFHLVENAPGRRVGRRSASTASGSSRSAHYDNGSGPHVQHDGAGAAHGRRRQRRQPAARRGHREMWRPIWPGVAGRRACRSASITNGVHVPTWIVVRDGAAVRATTSAATGSSATTTRRCGDACCDIPDDELWAARAGAARRTSSRSSASGRASAGPTSASAPRASSPPARCSTRTR